MGGGEGSTAREILRHKDVEKLVMCDIDEVIKIICPLQRKLIFSLFFFFIFPFMKCELGSC